MRGTRNAASNCYGCLALLLTAWCRAQGNPFCVEFLGAGRVDNEVPSCARILNLCPPPASDMPPLPVPPASAIRLPFLPHLPSSGCEWLCLTGDQVFFVMGLAEMGDLRAVLEEEDCPGYPHLVRIVRDSVAGLAHLHEYATDIPMPYPFPPPPPARCSPLSLPLPPFPPAHFSRPPMLPD